jgi:uncharacterized Zn finger protein
MVYYVYLACPYCYGEGEHQVIGWLYAFAKMRCLFCGENFLAEIKEVKNG